MSKRIVLDRPGPFAPGEVVTGLVEGLAPPDEPLYAMTAQCTAVGLGNAEAAEKRSGVPCEGEWLGGGRFQCRLWGSDPASRKGALFAVKWSLTLTSCRERSVTAETPIDVQFPAAQPSPVLDRGGYRTAIRATDIAPDVTQVPAKSTQETLGTPLGCILLGLMVVFGAWTIGELSSAIVGTLFGAVCIVIGVLGIGSYSEYRKMQKLLGPIVEVSALQVHRGHPLRVDIAFSPRQAPTVDVTVSLRKIEAVTSGSGSDFKSWQHIFVVAEQSTQAILKPGEDRIETVLRIPETEEPTQAVGEYSVAWDVVVDGRSTTTPSWREQFAIQVKP